MRRRSMPLLPATALTCLAPLAQQVFCCSCVRPREPLVALGRADAVFSGVVVAARDPHVGEAAYYSIDPLLYSIAVSKAWKGAVGPAMLPIQELEYGAFCVSLKEIEDRFEVR